MTNYFIKASRKFPETSAGNMIDSSELSSQRTNITSTGSHVKALGYYSKNNDFGSL